MKAMFDDLGKVLTQFLEAKFETLEKSLDKTLNKISEEIKLMTGQNLQRDDQKFGFRERAG